MHPYKKPALIEWSCLLLLLFVFLPMVQGGIPKEVENYCTLFSLKECSNHSSWFLTPACKSMIRCVSEIDENTLEFKGCKTVLKDVFDDCMNYPSTLCYNGVAYDTSSSETCFGAGARFRKIDGCGNPKEFGPCLKLDSCRAVTVSPYSGASITVHEGCGVLTKEQENNIERNIPAQQETEERGDEKTEADKKASGRTGDQGEQSQQYAQEDSKIIPPPAQKGIGSEERNRTKNVTVTSASSSIPQAIIKPKEQRMPLWLIAGIIVLIILIIALIILIHLWRRR